MVEYPMFLKSDTGDYGIPSIFRSGYSRYWGESPPLDTHYFWRVILEGAAGIPVLLDTAVTLEKFTSFSFFRLSFGLHMCSCSYPRTGDLLITSSICPL